MFSSRYKQAEAILAKNDAPTLLRDLLLNTQDHEERVRIIDRVRRQQPEIVHAVYEYMESGVKFSLPPGAYNDKDRKANVINELENALLKQTLETKTDVDLAVYSPKMGRSN